MMHLTHSLRIDRTRFLVALFLSFSLLALSVAAQPAEPDDDVLQAEVERLEEALDNPAIEHTYTNAHWKQFSEALVRNLALDHDGIREASLRMIIHYGKNLDVRSACFDVVRIYRSHPNANMRRMALVAIGEMKNDWAVGFTERLVQFEKDERLRRTGEAVVRAYRAPG